MEVQAIYTQFRQSLLNFIRSRIRSKEDAEDILHNVFIRISNNVYTLVDEQKLQSWIFTITRNAIIDYYRFHASRKNVAIDGALADHILEEDQPDATHGLDQCMNSMVNLLPDEYRDIIIDAELKGIKQKDLAVKYGIAYPSMRSRVQRGRQRLKQLFYNCCHIETDKLGNVMEIRNRKDCNEPCTPDCSPPD